MENGLLGIIPKSPFSFDFMRQNRLISFLSHELDVKKHFGFRRKFVTLCVINSQKQMRFLHSCNTQASIEAKKESMRPSIDLLDAIPSESRVNDVL